MKIIQIFKINIFFILILQCKSDIDVMRAIKPIKTVLRDGTRKRSSENLIIYEKRINRMNEVLKHTLDNADRIIYNTDPNNHIYGETYVAIRRFHQPYYTHEVNFDSCKGTCSDNYYKNATEKQNRYFLPDQDRCEGTLSNCENAKHGYFGSYMNGYFYYKPTEYSSHSRYCKANFANDKTYYGKLYARPGDCTKEQLYPIWYRTRFEICNMCLCTCDEPNSPHTIRKFIISPIKADVKNNYVITGIKFAEKDKKIMLIAQQSKLLPGGKIDSSTSEWIEPEDTSDTATLEIENNFYFGEVNAPNPQSVLTQIQILRYDFSRDFYIGVEFSPIDFQNGVVKDQYTWEFVGCGRLLCETKYTVYGSHNPISFNNNNIITKNVYVNFRSSSLEMDVGQSTVPFFDAQPLISAASPISGIGFHLRNDGHESGGFISPFIKTFNYVNMINDVIIPNNIDMKNGIPTEFPPINCPIVGNNYLCELRMLFKDKIYKR